MTQGGNYWTLFTPGIWKVLHAVLDHWEGDLILGLDSSAIGTLVERTTRFTMLLHLPRTAEYGVGARLKNGPALAGHGADAVRDSISGTITSLPEQLRRSLTWDQGKEMAQHARLKIDKEGQFKSPNLSTRRAALYWHGYSCWWSAEVLWPFMC